MVRRSLVVSSLLFVVACTGGGSTPGGDDGADPTPDARGPDPMPMLDKADCTPLANSMVAAAQMCGTSLPANARMQIETACKRGIDAAAMCGGDPAGGLECFATPDADDWVCAGGEPYPACGGDLGASLGAYCLLALGNPQCATGVACEYNADCSNGLTCNGATGQCMSKSAYCVGLPCQYNADCPDGHTCNGAEGACIIE